MLTNAVDRLEKGFCNLFVVIIYMMYLKKCDAWVLKEMYTDVVFILLAFIFVAFNVSCSDHLRT